MRAALAERDAPRMIPDARSDYAAHVGPPRRPGAPLGARGMSGDGSAYKDGRSWTLEYRDEAEAVLRAALEPDGGNEGGK